MKAELLQRNGGSTSQIRTYPQLLDQLHRDLRAQHPEWIDSNGNSPMCDSYERRLVELISIFQESNGQQFRRQLSPAVNW